MAQYSALFTLGLLARDPRPATPAAATSSPSSARSFLPIDAPRSPALSYLSLRSSTSSASRSRSRSRRPSRDNLPQAKPAPTASLPAPPPVPTLPLPPAVPPRANSLPSPPAPVTPSMFRPTHRPTHSVSSTFTAATSVRTTRAQAVHRDAALADLEGRRPYQHKPHQRAARRNFMSMSDDEDEDEAEMVKPPSVLAVRRTAVSISLPSTKAPSIATTTTTEKPTPATRKRSSTVTSLLLPTSGGGNNGSSTARGRRRSKGVSAGASAAANWLASFLDLDLRTDDDGSSPIVVGMAARAA